MLMMSTTNINTETDINGYESDTDASYDSDVSDSTNESMAEQLNNSIKRFNNANTTSVLCNIC